MLPLGHEQFHDVPAACNKAVRPIQGMGSPYAVFLPPLLSQSQQISSSGFLTVATQVAPRPCAGCHRHAENRINIAAWSIGAIFTAQGLLPCAVTVSREVPK